MSLYKPLQVGHDDGGQDKDRHRQDHACEGGLRDRLGERWEHCAHASFQILQWVGFNFLFYGIRCVPSEKMHFPIIRRDPRERRTCTNIFSAGESQLAEYEKEKNTHMSCSNFGGSHHVALVVQHINAFR